MKYYFNNYHTDLAKNMRLYLNEGILSFYQKYQPELEVVIEEKYLVDKQVGWFDIISTGILLLAVVIGEMFSFWTYRHDNWYYNYSVLIVFATLSVIISQKIYKRKLWIPHT